MRRPAHIAAVLATALIAAPAFAADYAAPRIDAPSVIPPEEIGTGWYLRGDISYDKMTVGSISAGFPGTTIKSPHANSEFSFGGGFGFKFNDWLRVDLTADYSKRSVDWRRTGGCYGFTCPGGSVNRGDLTMIPILANVYADLGNWGGITPYIGGGLGFAVMSLAHQGGSWSTGVTTVPGASYSNYSIGFDSYSRSTLAAAGMAGLSYDMGSGLQFDLGYRYLWVKDAKGGTSHYEGTTVTNPVGGVGGGTTNLNVRSGSNNGVTMKDIGVQQIRLGMRYFVY
ncbi:outer membrane protein [Prosthecomicrobium sp. N25]|uniref:outer membrane protein n=1 Tax=Prosthecomicrobium sp. N25 TaxID=3129254 RepID=UPI003077B82B